jgi:hypothetical protein
LFEGVDWIIDEQTVAVELGLPVGGHDTIEALFECNVIGQDGGLVGAWKEFA